MPQRPCRGCDVARGGTLTSWCSGRLGKGPLTGRVVRTRASCAEDGASGSVASRWASLYKEGVRGVGSGFGLPNSNQSASMSVAISTQTVDALWSVPTRKRQTLRGHSTLRGQPILRGRYWWRV